MAISERPDITDDSIPSKWDGQRMTLEEYLALPEQKPSLEYVDGVVRQKVAAKRVHGSLQAYLATVLNQVAWVGELGMAHTDTRFVTEGRALAPDVSFYRSGRAEGVDSAGRVPEDFIVPPDIAVEIKSPGQTVTAQLEKCARYQALGVPITLFIHPEERAVFELRPGQPLRVLQGDDRINLDEVLPGFQVALNEMFDSVAPAWFSRPTAQERATPDPESEAAD
ncbi:MAG TPA: Uma2 family endonuclease [Chloroflexota bacterium]|nr:Uma2 family endonuclease [Chloroflexota bacterium]